jgi:hypothetical protein
MFNLFVVGVKGESLGVSNLERGNTKLFERCAISLQWRG